MTYTVVWKPGAESALTQAWIEATDRRTLTEAADTIDALLRASPLEVGESRASPTRILVVSPLAVYYDVSEDDRLVTVWAMWRFREQGDE
jgi:hypothetical protein